MQVLEVFDGLSRLLTGIKTVTRDKVLNDTRQVPGMHDKIMNSCSYNCLTGWMVVTLPCEGSPRCGIEYLGRACIDCPGITMCGGSNRSSWEEMSLTRVSEVTNRLVDSFSVKSWLLLRSQYCGRAAS